MSEKEELEDTDSHHVAVDVGNAAAYIDPLTASAGEIVFHTSWSEGRDKGGVVAEHCESALSAGQMHGAYFSLKEDVFG
mgnify:FL=1|jgi:hypothetical protein